MKKHKFVKFVELGEEHRGRLGDLAWDWINTSEEHTQATVAKELGVSVSTLQRSLTGKAPLKLERVRQIMALCNPPALEWVLLQLLLERGEDDELCQVLLRMHSVWHSGNETDSKAAEIHALAARQQLQEARRQETEARKEGKIAGLRVQAERIEAKIERLRAASQQEEAEANRRTDEQMNRRTDEMAETEAESVNAKDAEGATDARDPKDVKDALGRDWSKVDVAKCWSENPGEFHMPYNRDAKKLERARNDARLKAERERRQEAGV